MASNFPHPTLTKLDDATPTQATLLVLYAEMNANAISVPSQRGNGALGHYYLVAGGAEYTLAAGNHEAAAPEDEERPIVFVPPRHPGNAPQHEAGATGNQITEVNRQFKVDTEEYMAYVQTEAALKRLLLEAVPSTFTKELRDTKLGYAKVSTLAILQHLENTYGTITADDLEKNLTAMNRQWDIHEPIENLFHQLKDAREFAATVDPISESMAVRAGVKILENTSSFTESIREWRMKGIAEQTLANFRTHFKKADSERNRKLTSQGAGYHQAAFVETANATNTTTPPPPLYYCFSHGVSFNPAHTSATCNRPSEHHNKNATIYDMLGGCNVVQRKKGEKQIFVRPNRTPATSNT